MTIASGLKYIYLRYIQLLFFFKMKRYLVTSPETVAFAVKLTSDKSETIYTILKVRHHIR